MFKYFNDFFLSFKKAKWRKTVEDTFKKMSDANDELAKLLEDDKKNELAEEVLFRDILAWLSL